MFYRLLTVLSRSQKGLIMMALDLFWVTLAFFFASILYNTGQAQPISLGMSLVYLLLFLPVAGTVIYQIGSHRIKLNSYGSTDIAHTFALALLLVATGALATLSQVFDQPLPIPALLNFGFIFAALSIGGRIALFRLVSRVYANAGKQRKKVLIYGAGQTGQQLAAALQTDNEFEAACFVDDNPNLLRLNIAGLRVHASKSIPMLVERIGIDRIVLAMPSVDQSVRLQLARKFSGLGAEVMALPSFADIVLKGEDTSNTPIELTSLLGRDAIESDLPTAEKTYRDQRILVTGAGGSIGSELCRQLILCRPAELVLADHSEIALYSVQRELQKAEANVKITPVLGSVARPELVREILRDHEIDVVFHAAAYKHVNIVQTNGFEGVRNNVLGTRIVAEEAMRAEVAQFVLVSSDKAVRPTSIMGCSKRMAELVVQDLATRSTRTKFSMVRFGNVLGSSGSVIPLFNEQIRAGGPVTVTDPEVTRFFMTVSEAVRLVLLASGFSRGGDVFVLDMGKPVSIASMAEKMIHAAGLTVRNRANPNGDIQIAFTGLKPGEKMHEELLIGSDMLTTPHPKILRAQENLLSELEIANALNDLRRAIETRDMDLLVTTLTRWVESDPPNADALTVVGEI